MHRFNHFAALDATHHIWLVGCNDQEKPGVVESAASFHDSGQYFEIRQSFWRIRLSIPNDSTVQNTVAVQKDSPIHFAGTWGDKAVSHLVPTIWSTG
ncbi:hypothetical protein SAE02_71430 [Skermanella aerolata]|uniref:Uncharacterized protein n=1 Tax=Skermanella aerolata TaxID=393310 RepID=A0A512E2Q4_9PROT|nr:hypothetical protein SAE02_71430 [Skermanella aerolata]